MRIAVDLDGVCYEFQRTYRYMLREYRGVDMPPVEEFWTTWDAQKQFGTSEDHTWMWTRGVELGLFRYGHMTTGARIGLFRLAEAGHELQVVTSRPASASEDTRDWINLYFRSIPLTDIRILRHGQAKTDSDADVLIDDNVDNLQAWVMSSRPAVQFVRPWNKEWGGGALVYRAKDWSVVPTAVANVEGVMAR